MAKTSPKTIIMFCNAPVNVKAYIPPNTNIKEAIVFNVKVNGVDPVLFFTQTKAITKHKLKKVNKQNGKRICHTSRS